ncbi:MAG: carbohydrate binding domain-containing protein [Planctomycetes bacterium]|nr:carbohydrate binding domain-containing protein [Planctomycetota bacterium]
MASTFARVVLFAVFSAVAGTSVAQTAAASRAQERQLEGMPKSTWFLVPPGLGSAPTKGHGLLVVLPGGDGSREFLPWVENSVHAQLPADFATALVVAPKWTDEQQIIWPTATNRVAGMEYTTEEYVRAVVADAGKALPIDPRRVLLLAWSSGGPAAYATLLAEDSPFAGAYVAMSIWPKVDAAALARAKGQRLLLDQSPQDQITKFSHVRKAHEALTGASAIVRVSTYHGGHGWHDLPLPRLRAGFLWLLGKEPAGKPKWPDDRPTGAGGKKPGKPGDNLLVNGSFEDGDEGWQTVGNSGRLHVQVQDQDVKDGKRALHLEKTGAMPLDLLVQEIDDLPKAGTVTARAWVRTKDCKNAWIKCFLYRGDELVHQDVDVAQLRGDAGWQQVDRSWPVAGATRAVFQIVLVMGGEVWVDGCEVVVAPAKK